MKAYIVVTDEFMHPTFAHYNMEARRKALNEFSLEPEEIERVRRAPELDKYLDYFQKWGEISRDQLLEEGWWFPCDWCERPVSKDMEYDEETQQVTQPVVGYGIYCSDKCHQAGQPKKK